MLEILGMMGNYDERKVENTKIEGIGEIDTARVWDCGYSYETAVEHKDFNNGEWIILEGYYTREEAKKGHKKWISKITDNDYYELTCIYSDETFTRNGGIK